jgi:hypothetical protein
LTLAPIVALLLGSEQECHAPMTWLHQHGVVCTGGQSTIISILVLVLVVILGIASVVTTVYLASRRHAVA